jgi:hypothetical protein
MGVVEMHALVMAGAALFGSPDLLDAKLKELWITQQMPVERRRWIERGVLEEYESYFQYYWRFEDDLEDMQWRVDNLPEDAPHISAVNALPSYEHADVMYQCSMRFVRWAQKQLKYLPDFQQGELLDAIADASWRAQVWGQVANMGLNWTTKEGRRYRLWELKQAVGEEGWSMLAFPHPLPDAARVREWGYGNDDPPTEDDD